MRWLAFTAGGLAVIGAALWGALVLSLRTGFVPVLDGLRRMNRRFTNPKVMKKAGRAGSNVAVIEHEGRISGSSYSTPIAVVETDTGFAVVLPYGTRPDWLKNVVAAGKAKLIHDGQTFELGSPAVVSHGSVEQFFSPRQRWANRLYGIDQVLVLGDPARLGGGSK